MVIIPDTKLSASDGNHIGGFRNFTRMFKAMGFWLFPNRLFHSFLKSFLDLLIIGPNGFRPVEMSVFRRGTSGSENRAQIHAVLVTETWFEKAAAQGDPHASYSLGLLYFHGRGVTKDVDKARELWEKAANKGVKNAQFNLGLLYYNGEEAKQDYAKARKWFEMAAAQNDTHAQMILGLMYEGGEGVKKDLATAREWYDKACKRGLKDACAALKRVNGQ